METLGELLPQVERPWPGPASKRETDRLATSECPALTQRRARRSERSGAAQDPIVWSEARGANVVDVDGRIYVDFSAGFGAACVGHSHPRIVATLQKQSARLIHALGDLHPSDVKIDLLERLTGLFGEPSRAMLGLSGADSVEAALKTALLFTGRPGVVAFEGSYHGLSHGPLAACGYSAAFREPFAAQLNPHVEFVPYPRASGNLKQTLDAVAAAISSTSAGAVLVEPMLGRGGVVVPPAEFLPELEKLCRARGVLLVCDEVLTGLGRCGFWLASHAAGVQPDLLCLGKALGAGMPVSACVGRADVMQAWGDPGREALHTGTFFGQPLACAAALTCLDIVRDEALPERAVQLGGAFVAELEAVRKKRPALREVRGRGLLLGLEFDAPAKALTLMQALLERGYITVPAAADASVLSLTPPLTITPAQLTGFTAALDASLEALS
jgi:4-aminobutyrate aminotransferase / (S)-3-amino-2-methylpropionate transaminase / 5-aminovalerate transaminase